MVSLTPTASELADLSRAAGKLWDLDSNRLVYGRDYEIQLQSCRQKHDGDVAPHPLFKRVDESVFEKPTFKAFVNLLDNYCEFTGDVEVVTHEEIKENNAFLNVSFHHSNAFSEGKDDNL
jgi:poly(U)-specific endoribonuclease